MSSHYQSNPGSRRGKWYSLFALSLITGVVFQQTATVWAQGAPAKPAPDVIVFTNGDQLTGTLERATGNSFVFKSDVVGEITVTADKIKELHAGGKFVALKKGEKITRTSKQPGTVTYADNAVTLTNSSSSVETIPTKELTYIIDQKTYNQ